MQSWLSKRRCRSAGVSLPSLPSFSARADDFPEDEDCSLSSDLFLFFLESESDFFLSEFSDLLLSGLFFSVRDFSRLRSQCRASMECARVFIASRVAGLPCWPIMSLMRSAKPE